jgi:hypothetical protein
VPCLFNVCDHALCILVWELRFFEPPNLHLTPLTNAAAVGGAIYFIAVQKEDIDRYFTYCAVLYFLSYVFWGAALFSLLLSVKTIGAKGFSVSGVVLMSVLFELVPIVMV